MGGKYAETRAGYYRRPVASEYPYGSVISCVFKHCVYRQIIYLIFNIEQTSGIVTGRGTIALPDYLLFLKLCTNDHVSSIPLNFTLCIRLLNYLVILIGASQETIEDTMNMNAVDYITKMFSTAGIHYTFGIRGFYYTIPLIGWFLGTWLFIALTIIVLFLCLRLDYGK